jgi:hypothetical protein
MCCCVCFFYEKQVVELDKKCLNQEKEMQQLNAKVREADQRMTEFERLKLFEEEANKTIQQQTTPLQTMEKVASMNETQFYPSRFL